MKKNNRKSNALCKLSTGAADKRRHLKTGFKIWGIKETNFRHQEISSSAHDTYVLCAHYALCAHHVSCIMLSTRH